MTILRVAHSAHGAGNCPLLIAMADGFFEAEGLDVKRTAGPSTGPLLDELLTNGCDFAISAGIPIISAAEAGGTPVVLLSLVSRNLFAIVARAGIYAEDLQGARIGVTGVNDQDGIVMRRALQQFGIPETAVEFVELKSRDRLWKSLETRDIAAFAVTPPLSVRAKLAGYAVLHDFFPKSPHYQLGSIITTQQFRHDNDRAVRRFIRALRRGIKSFETDIDHAMPYLRECTGLTDETVLRRTHAVFAKAMKDARPRAEALDNVRRDLEFARGTSVNVDCNDLVDTSVFDTITSVGETGSAT